MLHNFDWLFFYYFLQLIFRLTPLTSTTKSNEKLVNQTLCKTILILDAHQIWISWFFSLNLSFSPFTIAVMKRIYAVMFFFKNIWNLTFCSTLKTVVIQHLPKELSEKSCLCIFLSISNFWTNWGSDLCSTSKWPSEPKFCERYLCR